MERPRWGLPRRLFTGPSYRTPGSAHVEEANPTKVSLRMQAYNLLAPHEVVLDLFAGKGLLSWLYAKGCRRLISVEKNPEYFKVLKRNMSEYPHAICLQRDNLEFLESGDLAELEGHITYVDFDAFGCPSLQVQRFFERYRVERAMVVSLTDGILFNFRRHGSADLRRYYLQDFYVGGEPECGVTQSLGEYLFTIQSNFINILCMRWGLAAHPLYFKVNERSTATYSSYLILPRIVGVVDFKRYVGLRRLKVGTAATSIQGSA
ncbi:MAG: hypothetical protein QXJ75_05585 [Candidatus Bathyarchaeia archaeon]